MVYGKIVQNHPTLLDMRRENNDFIYSIIIFGCVGILIIIASRYVWTQLHWKFEDRGRPGLGISILRTVFHMTLTFNEHTVHRKCFFR